MMKKFKGLLTMAAVGIMTAAIGFTAYADQGKEDNSVTEKIREIVSVESVKALNSIDFKTDCIGDMYVVTNYDNYKHDYYNRNFEYQFSVPDIIEGNSVKFTTAFIDGITIAATYSEYGYYNSWMYAFDGAGNRIYNLGVISDLYRFTPGQDPNGMTMFTWTKHSDALRFMSYSSAAGFSEKIYYYTDYPELEKVNAIKGFTDGKANLICKTVDKIEHEGYINQKVYYNYENVASVDTLGNLGPIVPLMDDNQNVADYHVSQTCTSKLGDTGAYFASEGEEIVLRDATGAEKFRTDGWSCASISFFVNVVDENYFIARPKGQSDDSPAYLYKVTYK